MPYFKRVKYIPLKLLNIGNTDPANFSIQKQPFTGALQKNCTEKLCKVFPLEFWVLILPLHPK